MPALSRARSSRMISTTRSTRSWYSSREAPGHLLPQSERQQRDRDQDDGGKGEEQARAQAHRLISRRSRLRSRNPPSHSAVTPDRPRRTIACSRVSTSGTMVSGSSQRRAVHQRPAGPGTGRAAGCRATDVAGVGSQPPRPRQRARRSTRWRAGMSGADDPEAARRETPSRRAPRRGPGRRGARPDRARRRRSRRRRFAGSGEVGCAAERLRRSQSAQRLPPERPQRAHALLLEPHRRPAPAAPRPTAAVTSARARV